MSGAKTRYAIDVVGLSAMTIALILNVISPDRISLAVLAFGASCFTITALLRYRQATRANAPP